MSVKRPLTAATGTLVLWTLGTLPATAQTLGQGGGADINWWRVIGALIFCILLAVGAAFALKMRLPGGPKFKLPTNLFAPASGRLRLVETLRLTQQIDICVFQLDEREFVVAASPQGPVLLATGEAPKPATDQP